MEEMLTKSAATKKCSDILEIVQQIVIHAPDKEAALEAINEVAGALKNE